MEPAEKYNVSNIPKSLRLRAICDWESKHYKNTGFHEEVFRYLVSVIL